MLGDWNGDGCTDIISLGGVYISNCAGGFATVGSPWAGNPAIDSSFGSQLRIRKADRTCGCSTSVSFRGGTRPILHRGAVQDSGKP